MLTLTITSPVGCTDEVQDLLINDPAVSSVAVIRGASVKPAGDVVTADVAREGANDTIRALIGTGVHREGTIHIDDAATWVSANAYQVDNEMPGDGVDAVVWAEVVQRAYSETLVSWIFLAFMIMATLIAGIGIIIDSQILLIGSMVLGPEFGAIAAIGIALVSKRPRLIGRAFRTLIVGFVVGISFTTAISLMGRWLNWVTVEDFTRPRPDTAFIYTPDRWSLVVALIAGVAGVLSMTSNRAGALAGVFISVTTIPAAGNIALGLAFQQWHEVWGSTVQLIVNIMGMGLAGWLALLTQQKLWSKVHPLQRLGHPQSLTPPPPD